MLEGDTIINMGFFIHDLHKQIQQLYQKQVADYRGKSFIVYRGQGLLKTDFEKLMKTKGGLMSFNNFLSTSEEREVSLGFAKNALTKTNMVGVLFKMTIDPSVSSAPFASIRDVSFFQTEAEILFSMHTIFRIGEINKMENNDSLYQVDLKLTADDDQQLRTLTERIRKEVVGAPGWQRLGQLLVKLSQFDKAEELYNVLLEQTSDQGEKATYYNNLGYIKDDQGDYENAIEYHEKALEIRQKTLPPNHPDLAQSYNNIGGVYDNMGEYSKALSFYEKALEIYQKTLPPNHPDLATSYNNIAMVYMNMGEYSKALSFFEKTHEIFEKTLPPNHPSLATSYNNIGGVYRNMGEYSKALSFYEKALEIKQKTLPPNHPSLAASYNNIAFVYDSMREYSKALAYFERALDIYKRSLPPNHPHTQSVRESIEFVKKKL
jgi:tetratricopeptide (TPR) repeat protein